MSQNILLFIVLNCSLPFDIELFNLREASLAVDLGGVFAVEARNLCRRELW